MPNILYKNGYRFFFYSNDDEPIHVHVEKNDSTAKFNLEPVELVRSGRFNAKELKEIRFLIEENVELLKNEWYEFFNNN